LTIRFSPWVLAVDDFSLDINEGDFVSIVGPSGCGKTTVLNQHTGLLPSQLLISQRIAHANHYHGNTRIASREIGISR